MFSRDSKPTQPASDALQRPPGSGGNSDIHQEEMANPDGNAGLTGDVSLNTTAWDYAPWLQRFGRELMHRWMAPPAYYLGLFKGGWVVIELEISRSGKLLRFQILEQQGHPFLINAAESAVRNMAPYEALPADFPEPTLILRLRMIYPYIPPR
jgi:outer membrane biosynthesis protein TonB